MTSNDIRTLSDFRESRTLMSKAGYEETYGCDDYHEEAIAILQYGYECGWRIDILKGGRYYLHIERSMYESRNLKDLEKLFWDDFVKHELGR